MLDREVAWRADKRFANRLRNAKMRFPNACIEDINFAAPRASIGGKSFHLRRVAGSRHMNRLSSPAKPAPEKPGWLAPSPIRLRVWTNPLPMPACPRLFEEMATARLDGRFPRLIDKLARVQLLVLDDWGTHSLTDQQRLGLLELFEERYQRRSTIITAQLPVSGWHQMIGEPTIADAILDRIIHNAHRIELKGDSMRRKSENPGLTQVENPEIITQDE